MHHIHILYCNLLSHSEKPFFVMCTDGKQDSNEPFKPKINLSRLCLKAELPIKSPNGCIPLQSATAMHDYLDIRTLTIGTE